MKKILELVYLTIYVRASDQNLIRSDKSDPNQNNVRTVIRNSGSKVGLKRELSAWNRN